ncbi:MAG: DUF262 domain-containing protein [Paludibacteraceae bacterium]|nr:DUF262 domain-containing protein [Paludibacteraceae bacterium]
MPANIEKISIRELIIELTKGNYALPEFQRDYEWRNNRVKKFLISLYKGYPCGTFLLWKTTKDKSIMRSDILPEKTNEVTLILDGQQRMTSIYGIIYGTQPKQFCKDAANVFPDFWFNLYTEKIEIYNKTKMETPQSRWVSIRQILGWWMNHDIENIYALYNKYSDSEKYDTPIYHKNIKQLISILEYEFPTYTIGKDTELTDVIAIFDRVNTGGKSLNEADIAIAKLCGKWDDARRELLKICTYNDTTGAERYKFGLDTMLRMVTIFTTGQPRYNKYFDIMSENITEYANALPICQKYLRNCLDSISQTLGLDSNLPGNNVLASPASLMTMVYYLKLHQGSITATEWSKLLYWYIQSFLMCRYSNSFILNIATDIKTLNENKGIDGLIDNLIKDYHGGNKQGLVVKANDFTGQGMTTSHSYSLLYMLTRHYKSKDFVKGYDIQNAVISPNARIEVHHIFPQSILRSLEYKREQIDTIANYALITSETNKVISNKAPKDYFPEYIETISTHWIPISDETLWEYENYERFLTVRRELLAEAANELLHSLNPEHPKSL